ncbi:MAG: cytochrome c [Rhodospirillales bacterium]|nr:cytochrome c [Rhodospirillales bacterium]
MSVSVIGGWVRALSTVAATGCFVIAANPSHAGDAAAGRKKASACAVCHGQDGLGVRPDVPHIAGQSEIYMRAQLEKFRSGERTHQEMNIIAGDLTDEDMDDLVAYYSAIKVTVEVPK